MPDSEIISKTSSIIDSRNSTADARCSSARLGGLPCSLRLRSATLCSGLSCSPRRRTFPDNSRGRFVRSAFQFFPRIKCPAACRSGQFGRQLSPRIESAVCSAAQTTCRPRVAPAKNHARTKRKNPRAQRDLSAVSDPSAGQFEERRPSARESGERRAKGGEPIRGSHSGTANPFPSPHSPAPKKPGEFERNLASSKKHASFQQRKLGEFERNLTS